MALVRPQLATRNTYLRDESLYQIRVQVAGGEHHSTRGTALDPQLHGIRHRSTTDQPSGNARRCCIATPNRVQDFDHWRREAPGKDLVQQPSVFLPLGDEDLPGAFAYQHSRRLTECSLGIDRPPEGSGKLLVV